MSSMNIESVQETELNHDEYATTTTAHTVNKDSWQQVGLLLATSFNCAYVFSFSNLLIVPLGWFWGLVCLFTIAGFSFYANCLLADFHVIDGQRFIRFRDLMGFAYGKKLYYSTWFFQFVTLILGNMSFILLGGRALKAINSEFTDDPLRLQVFICITGLVYCIFSYLVPTISDMRNWIAVSLVLTTTYIVTLMSIVIKDGASNKSRDYNLEGNTLEKFFRAFGAIAATLVASNAGMVPELQSTLRHPVVANMKKALATQFSFGLIVYYGVTITGYWAYGSSVSEYLPKNLSGPKWAKILINITAFLQNIISQHMFISPVHEALDTKFLKLDKKITSSYNRIRLVFLRAILFAVNTLVTCVFPFMGDIIGFAGAITLFGLVFIFPSLIFLKVRAKTATRKAKAWHWSIIIVAQALSVISSASFRLISDNARKYKFFADT